jgi:hypothetical protein
MNGLLTTNVRDKIALIGLVIIAVLSFVTIWIFALRSSPEVTVVMAMIGLIGTVAAVFAAIFRGNASPTVSPAPPSSPEQPAPPPSVPTHPLGGAPQTITPISDMLKG